MCVVLWVAVGMAGNLDTPGLRMRQPCTISPTWFTSQNRYSTHTAHNAQAQCTGTISDSESRWHCDDTPWNTSWFKLMQGLVEANAKSITFSFKTSATRCHVWSFQPSSSQTVHEVNISEWKKHEKGQVTHKTYSHIHQNFYLWLDVEETLWVQHFCGFHEVSDVAKANDGVYLSSRLKSIKKCTVEIKFIIIWCGLMMVNID